MKDDDDRIIYLDIESLLLEYQAAEQEVLLFQQAHPELAEIPDVGFEKLMEKIEQLNIQPKFMADRRKKKKRSRPQ